MGMAVGFRSALCLSLLRVVRSGEDDGGSTTLADLQWEIWSKKWSLFFVEILFLGACVAVVHLFRINLINKKAHQETRSELAKHDREHFNSTCKLQDEIGDLKVIQQQKKGVERELKLAKGDVGVLQSRLEKSESDCKVLTTSLKASFKEAAEMRIQLSDAQEWQKECIYLDKELKELHETNKNKDEKILAMGEELTKAEGWEKEHNKLQARVEELTSTLNEKDAELKVVEDIAKGAQMWKSRSNTHSEDKVRLISCIRDHVKEWEALEQQKKLWKDRAKEFEEENKALEAGLEEGVKKYEELEAWSIVAHEQGAKLSEQLKEKAADLAAVMVLLDSTKKEFEQVKGALEIMVVGKTEVQKELQKVQEVLQKVQEELQKVQKELQKVVREHAVEEGKLLDSLASSQNHVAKLEGDVEKMATEVQENQKVGAELQSALENEREQASELRSLLDAETQKVAQVEQALGESEGKCEQLEKDFAERVKENQMSLSDVEALHESVQKLQQDTIKKIALVNALTLAEREKYQEVIEGVGSKQSEEVDAAAEEVSQTVKGDAAAEEVRQTVEDDAATEEVRQTVEDDAATEEVRQTVEDDAATEEVRQTVEGDAATEEVSQTVEGDAAAKEVRQTVEGDAATEEVSQTVEGDAAAKEVSQTVEGDAAAKEVGQTVEGDAAAKEVSQTVEGDAWGVSNGEDLDKIPVANEEIETKPEIESNNMVDETPNATAARQTTDVQPESKINVDIQIIDDNEVSLKLSVLDEGKTETEAKSGSSETEVVSP